jgi:hypothetical protein
MARMDGHCDEWMTVMLQGGTGRMGAGGDRVMHTTNGMDM